MSVSGDESDTTHSPPPNKLRRTAVSPTISSARVQKSLSQSRLETTPISASDQSATAQEGASVSPSPPPSDLDDAPSQKRVSYYVQAMDELIESVLRHESFLFSPREQHALRRLQILEYQARYLFIRLYLRKDQWIRLQNIGYENDIEDVQAACQALWQTIIFTPEPPLDESVKAELDLKPLTQTARPAAAAPAIVARPDFIDLTADSDDEENEEPKVEAATADGEDDGPEPDLDRLAYGRDDLLQADPSVVMGLLSLEELVTLGKKMKVNPGRGSRKDWTQGLLKTSSQATLSFFASSKDKGKENADVKPLGSFGVGYDAKGNKLKASSVASSHALRVIGPVIRLSPEYRTLFDRLSLVFHRTSYTAGSNTTSFTSSLLARFGKRRFPDYTVSRTFAIFPSRSLLKQYEKALEVERRIEEILGEVGWEKLPAGTPRRIKTAEEKKAEKDAMCRDGITLFLSIEKSWELLCKGAEKEMKLEEDDQEKRLLYYRRRFHPGWPLTRVVSKATGIYAKLDQHDREVQLLRALLAQMSFHRGKRGAWYDRLALVMMRYPLGDENSPTVTEKRREKLARKRKEDALALCLQALKDPATHLIYRSSLQRRVTRIESSLDVPKDNRRVFPELLKKSESRIMEGERLDDPTIGKKSIWQARDGSEVSVEELALEQYTKEGWKGFHSENGILTTIFALCFWDVIFAPVDGVFETAYQSAPLDLRTDAFAVVRRPLVDARLEALRRGEAGTILAQVDDRERARETWAVGVNWSKFSKEDLLEIVDCIGGGVLATVLTMFVEEYGERTGGIPDLCLWNPTTSTCKFSEVKGPGDSLSETQKVWIDVLLGAGIEVEVCKVMTHEDKNALDAKVAKAASAGGTKGGRQRRGKTSGGDSDEEE